MSQCNPILNTPRCLLKIIYILWFTTAHSKQYSPQDFVPKFCMRFLRLHPCYMSRQLINSWFLIRNYIWRRTRSMKPSWYYFSASCRFVPLRFKKQTPWPLVRKRTIPTERPPLSGTNILIISLFWSWNLANNFVFVLRLLLLSSTDWQEAPNTMAFTYLRDGKCSQVPRSFPLVDLTVGHWLDCRKPVQHSPRLLGNTKHRAHHSYLATASL
jgi:hypothetical protein